MAPVADAPIDSTVIDDASEAFSSDRY